MDRLSRAQVRSVDRLAVEKYRIAGIVLMENAARAAADVAEEMLGDILGMRVLILCGGGNNGGDGLALARHLHNRGSELRIMVTADPEKYGGEAKINWEIIQAMGLASGALDLPGIEGGKWDLIVDAIFGTGLTGPARAPFGEIVQAVRKSGSPVLAIDIPSGLDCDTGRPMGECMRANRTITFVAEKIGFANPAAKEFLGEISVGDIGCPKELIEEVLG